MSNPSLGSFTGSLENKLKKSRPTWLRLCQFLGTIEYESVDAETFSWNLSSTLAGLLCVQEAEVSSLTIARAGVPHVDTDWFSIRCHCDVSPLIINGPGDLG